MKESGYDGRPVTVVHVTDTISFLSAAALVTRELPQSAGFTVEH